MGVVMVMSSLGRWVVTTVAAELHAGCRMSFQLSREPGELLQQCTSVHPLPELLREGSWRWLLSDCGQ